MSAPIIKLSNVTKAFGTHIVLKRINLEIKEGEVLGIIGVSGSGKTTLLRTIVGFLKPEEGEIFFRKKGMLSEKENTLRQLSKNEEAFKKMYGFAPQYHSFYEKLTVIENLYYFGSLYGLDREVIKSNSDALIKMMQLENFKHHLAENLSGGMQRRLDIACSLIHEPDILLLDEPTADLDPLLRRHILEILKEINRRGTTIIISSHDLEEVEWICDRIAIIQDGRIITIGSPEEIKNKYGKTKTLIIESHPGNYKNILKGIKGGYHSYIIDGARLLLETDNAWNLIKQVISAAEKNKEEIIDINTVEPSLKEVFIKLTGKNE